MRDLKYYVYVIIIGFVLATFFEKIDRLRTLFDTIGLEFLPNKAPESE
jgi:hypothetical protein